MDRTLIREKQTSSVQEPALGESRRLGDVVGHSTRSDTVLTETDLAYVAGIVDGEGCIQVQKYKKRKRERSTPYKLQLRVSNTDLRLVQHLQSLFPGYIYNGSEKRKNRRNQFYWHVNGKKAAHILEKLVPFLVSKKDQAEIAIAFQDTFNQYYGIYGLPKEIIAFREECYQKCRKLKKKEFKPLLS
jgi:hypothetical protein